MIAVLERGEDHDPLVELATVVASSEVEDARWDAELERFGGPLFHTSTWARYRCFSGGSALFFHWHLEGRPEPVALALGVQKPSPGSAIGRIASRLHFNSAPAAGESLEFAAPLDRWARKAPGVVSLTLGALDARVPWSLRELPGAVRRREFLVERPPGTSFLKNMRSGTRESVARARRRGVEVRQTVAPADLVAFARLHEESNSRLRRMKRARIERTDPEAAAESLGLLTTGGRGRLYLAEQEGRPLAGCFFGCFAGTGYYLQSGAVERARELGAIPLALLEAFEDLTAAGFGRLNLGGIAGEAASDAAHPDRGLYEFKLGLGSRPLESVAGAVRVKPIRARGFELARKLLRR